MSASTSNCRFRFSLRAILVLITAVCALLAGEANRQHRARQQRDAVARVKASNPGALLLYDRQVGADGQIRPMPAAWRNHPDIDYFASVAGADLAYATDADLKLVARLPKLRRLCLVRAVDVTDAGLAHLEGLKRLKLLVLEDADQVTDQGLRSIGRLKSLTFLRLDVGRRMTPAGIEQLKRDLPRCRIEIRGPDEEVLAVLACDGMLTRFVSMAPISSTVLTTSGRTFRRWAGRRCRL